MTKKYALILMLFFICQHLVTKAQQYGNEWINYTQSYFKFAVVKDSIYRIPVTQLFAAGMPSTVKGENLQLFKDGVEQAIFISQTNTLTAGDYLDFYGTKADGKLDTRLYKNPDLQLNSNMSLVMDTAFYFITYNNLNTNKRFTQVSNNTANPPAKEDYCLYKLRTDFRNEFVSGKSDPIGNAAGGTTYYNLNSSQYEEEGFVKKTVTTSDSVIFTCSNAYKASGAPNSIFKSAITGKSFLQTHGIKVFANSNLIADSTYGSFDVQRFNIDIPMSLLTAQDRLSMRYTPYLSSGGLSDRFGIAYAEVVYPRQFNFNNAKMIEFELPPKSSDYYLEITNFSFGSTQPRLLDLTTNQFLVGDIATIGMVKFLISGNNIPRRFILHNTESINSYGTISNITPVAFKNYTNTNNQGNYIIITPNNILNPSSGNNGINDYVTYRKSISGGSYDAIAAKAEDIYNEFGYGYSYSTLALKNFLQFAHENTQWANKPKHVFLVGKGINYASYIPYRNANANTPGTFPFEALPSFGHPCSDLLLVDFDKNYKPKLSIGRLPAANADELSNYLTKVRDYESVLQNTTTNTSAEKLWQKRILHVAGGKDASEQGPITNSLTKQENIIKSPFYGAKVTTIKKSSTSSVDYINSALIDSLVNTGVSMIQFFGHSSADGIDYNLGDPNLQYNNYRKYPIFIANGCNAGDMFVLNSNKFLSEKWTLSPDRGSIAFIACVNTGFTSSLGAYTDSLYKRISSTSYGKTIGEQIQDNVNTLMSTSSFSNNFLFRMHAEQILLNGDPGVMMYSYAKPDYAIEEGGIAFKPFNLTTTIDSFDASIALYNLGKYTTDSFQIRIQRITPNGTKYDLYNSKQKSFANTDTIRLRIPILGNSGLGINRLLVELDQDGLIDETSEANNLINYQFNIFNDDLTPVYPYEFSIVNNSTLILKASTLNAFASMRDYLFQIDTTELFNSPKLLTHKIASKGGVISWQPSGMNLIDSTVYYWRTAMDTTDGNTKHRWTTSSFTYLPQAQSGWNQSHYFQFRKNNFSKLELDSATREFKYLTLNNALQVNNACLYGPNPFQYIYSDNSVDINGSGLYSHGCDIFPLMQSLQFVVIDTLSGEPWINTKDGNTGRFGSLAPCRIGPSNARRDPFFEFPFDNSTNRAKIVDFLDSIPQGSYLLVQSRLSCKGFGASQSNTIFIDQWKNDTLINGAGNSLYHKLFNMGFTQIDSFTFNRPFVFFQKKNIVSSTIQEMGKDSTIRLQVLFNFNASESAGTILTDKIGPAKSWTQYIKYGTSIEGVNTDSVSVDILGIDSNANETWLASVKGDTSLSFIDANIYPFLRLKMHSSDIINSTPEQLKKWRIIYQPVPEAALNPNFQYSFADTLTQGQIKTFSVAIENLTEIAMDSMLVKYQLIDSKNNSSLLGIKRFAPLPPFAKILSTFDVNTIGYNGNYTVRVEANPDNDQPEQFHPNNIGLKNIFIEPDKSNPLVDVTFDGIHILDKDIVSAKPFILITLNDENKFLALNDTSLIQVFMKYPGNNFTEVPIPFDGNILKFIPANLSSGNGKNQARLEYRPSFTVDGNEYVLIVKARDRVGNFAGSYDYKVGFSILNKSSISSLVNYPNPFTTSTQFVFTLTGSVIPSNLRIQILSTTGKVVREITKAELGPIHIGRNITEFKWKGDDQYGDLLGNGVYLYRVISNLNGEKMEHYQSDADKWMQKGFGKLYIMR